MAARARKLRHDDETRRRIKTSQLLNRLSDHAFSDKPLMDSSQVTAALGVLKKSLPDLASVELTGEGGGPVVISWLPTPDV